MNRDDIIRLMAAITPEDFSDAEVDEEKLDHFMPLFQAIANAERAACVRIVEREAMTYADPVWAVEIVNDIRARDPNYIAPKPEPFDPVAYREMINKVTKTALKILDDTLAKQGKP